MYDKCYFCSDQLPKLKKESTASFFVNFGGAGVQKSRPTLLYNYNYTTQQPPTKPLFSTAPKLLADHRGPLKHLFAADRCREPFKSRSWEREPFKLRQKRVRPPPMGPKIFVSCLLRFPPQFDQSSQNSRQGDAYLKQDQRTISRPNKALLYSASIGFKLRSCLHIVFLLDRMEWFLNWCPILC